MAVAAAVAFLLVTSPYAVYIYRVTGSWALSGKQGLAVDIARAVVKRDQAELDRVGAALDSTGREILWLSLEQFNTNTASYMLENPRRFFWQVRQNVSETWRALFHQDLFSPWMVALIALGLAGGARPWTRARLRGELLLLLTLAPLASLWAFFVISRLLALAIPIGLLWAAAGLEHLASWAEDGIRYWVLGTARPAVSAIGVQNATGPTPHAVGQYPISNIQYPLARTLPLILTVAALLWAGADVVRRELPAQPFWRVKAGRWLATHVPAGSPLMVRDSEVALYAGLPMVAFPNAEWPQVLAYGQARGARYLAVEDKEITELRPQLAPLLDTGHPLPGLTFLAQLPGPSSRKTLIYEFEAGP